MTQTELVAWWGAVVATIVLMWDIYKWGTSGPKIRVNVRPNMQLIGLPSRETESLILVEAVNIGDRPTTLTIVGLVYYKSWLGRLCKKPAASFVTPDPALTQPLPFVLEPGKMWAGGITQDEELTTMAREGHLICQLYDSWHTKPFGKRVALSRKPPTLETREQRGQG